MNLRIRREGLSPGTASSIDRSLNQKPPVTSITASRTIKADAGVILADATAGAVTVTLPTARSATGAQIVVKKTDASANAVIIDGDNAETIDGAATKSTTTQWAGWTIVSSGAAWFIVN